MNIIESVSSLITDDPDLFLEVDASMNKSLDSSGRLIQPTDLNSTEIEKAANEIAGEEGLDTEVSDELEIRKDAYEDAEEQQRRELLPHINKLSDTTKDTDMGIATGMARANETHQALDGLEDEMSKLYALVGNIGNTIS